MRKKMVLVVDDEERICSQFAEAFAVAGYEVQTAGRAEEALAVMRKAPAEVLFLDLNLPGMNGLELCREIRHAWPWTIVIAVTGYASLFELVDCREAGFEDYFIKPVSLEDLLAAAAQAFKKIERWKER
jgi:DNA-binding response OmpR family regulator